MRMFRIILAPIAALYAFSSFAAIEEIVVTAQKRSENLQDVPISIQALGGERRVTGEHNRGREPELFGDVAAFEVSDLVRGKYLSQNVSQFVVHGNINDYVPVERDGVQKYYRIREFLNEEMFKGRDVVIYYDRAAGIRFQDDRTFGGAQGSC